MLTQHPSIVAESNLSRAWARAFLIAMDSGSSGLAPLTLTIGFDGDCLQEEASIRRMVDAALAGHQKQSCETSAMVIFPFKLWQRLGHPDVEHLTNFYLEQFLPRMKARDASNRHGTYFERLVRFHGAVSNPQPRNQLSELVAAWQRAQSQGRRPRMSALQLACFDLFRDQNGSARSGFPCVHQVGLVYDSDGIALNAYYPTQYIFDRAYGNYLGLCQLGRFLESQLATRFVRLNCFIGHPTLGDVPKSALRPLASETRLLLGATEPNGRKIA